MYYSFHKNITKNIKKYYNTDYNKKWVMAAENSALPSQK